MNRKRDGKLYDVVDYDMEIILSHDSDFQSACKLARSISKETTYRRIAVYDVPIRDSHDVKNNPLYIAMKGRKIHKLWLDMEGIEIAEEVI